MSSKVRKTIRKLIKEELSFQRRNDVRSRLTAEGFIQKFLEAATNEACKALKRAYDIEFSSPIAGHLSTNVDFEVYNQSQDIFYEGNIMMVELKSEKNILFQVSVGPIGASVGEQTQVIDKKIGYGENPLEVANPVAALRGYAGR